MKPLPESAIIRVDECKADTLLAAAEKLPVYANRDYYNGQKQVNVYNGLRVSCPDEFDTLEQLITRGLQQAPYAVLIKGLKFDRHYRLFVALNRAFGKMVARPFDEKTPRAQLIHHVEPQTDISSSKQTGSKLSEKLHIDGADRPIPIRYLSMLCVRADPKGQGCSRLLDINGFKKVLSDGALTTKQMVLLQQHALPWQLADYFGGGVCWRTILTQTGINWRRYTLNATLANEKITLSSEMLTTLDRVDCLIEQDNPHEISFLMSSEDFLLMDNQRCLHARSPITTSDSNRLMLRGWVE